MILIFWTKFAQKRLPPVKNRKGEYCHWILHIWISLGTKFWLILAIVIFWTKFFQIGLYHRKQKNPIFLCPWLSLTILNFLYKGWQTQQYSSPYSLFRGADRHNSILMSLLLPVAETMTKEHYKNFIKTSFKNSGQNIRGAFWESLFSKWHKNAFTRIRPNEEPIATPSTYVHDFMKKLMCCLLMLKVLSYYYGLCYESCWCHKINHLCKCQ